MKPGDIVLVAFPRTDLLRGKLRPALVLALMPGRHEDVLLAMISSKTHQFVVGFDEFINEDDPEFATSGLKTASVIRLSRLATVERRLIVAKLGEIEKTRLLSILERIINLLDSQKGR